MNMSLSIFYYLYNRYENYFNNFDYDILHSVSLKKYSFAKG